MRFADFTAPLRQLETALGLVETSAEASVLAACPPRGSLLRVDDVDLHYYTAGESGPVVVYLHGAGGTLDEFLLSPLPALLARRYRVLAFDRPGYGHSTRPRSDLTGPAAQAMLLRQALRQLGIMRPILIGHSWSGALVLDYACQFPRDLAGVVVLSGWCFPALQWRLLLAGLPALPVLGPILNQRLAAMAQGGMALDVITQIFAPNPVPDAFGGFPLALAIRPSQLRANAADLGAVNPAVARLQPLYPELKCPLEIIAGLDDQIVDPHAHAQRLAGLIPRARLSLLPGIGHMPHHILPDAIREAVDRLAAS